MFHYLFFFFFSILQNLEEKNHILEGEISLLQDEYRTLASRTNAGQDLTSSAHVAKVGSASNHVESGQGKVLHVVEGPSLSMPAARYSAGRQHTQPDTLVARPGHEAPQNVGMTGLSSDIDAKTKEARAMLDELVVADGQSEDDVCISKHAFVLISDVVPLISCFHVES